MISQKMLDAVNAQITKEFYSAYLYLSMASYFESETLPGCAHWMRIQAQEESCHGLIFFNYVCDQDGHVTLGPIPPPPAQFESALDAFRKVASHEREVTASIYDLVDIALVERDHATHAMLQWFVSEQVEEESSAKTIIGKLERIKGTSDALLLLDNNLGTRVFAMPSPLVKAP